MVNRSDLAKLKGVDDEAHVTVRGEPHPVMLKRGLVAVAATARVAADIENRWKFGVRFCFFGQIEVSSDVEPRAALEVKFLDPEPFVPLQNPGDARLQRCSFRKRPQTEHFEVLLTQRSAARFPARSIGDALQECGVQPLGLLSHEGLDHRLAV